MASCKDCINYDACKVAKLNASNEVENWCDLFKDHFRFIELPCKVGDSVFTIDKEGNIQECIVINVNCKTQMTSDKELWIDFIIGTEPVDDSLPFPMIFTYSIAKNHILFLTRESAEKALKEHEK